MDVTGLHQRRGSLRPQELLDAIREEQAWMPPPPPSRKYSDGDGAAGPRHQISLSNPGVLPKLCSCIPGIILFPLMLSVIATAILSQQAFYWITAGLAVYTAIYTTNLSISCAIGAWRMRRDARRDWHGKLLQLQERNPEAKEVMHIVFLPNYKEGEDMLLHSLETIGRSAMARESLHVVLAMEEREGQEAKDKAERLIQKTSHLFADIFATFHPPNLPGDMAGKSSNCQWAYRKALQRFAAKIGKLDASKVFLTCCDADTLFHPQFFSALAYQAFCLPMQERVWSIFQPPILLMRNLFSSPAPTRVSGYGTILFELAGVTNQKFAPHMCHSTYSLTLALASHPLVDGWDRDVIAEDHHMFCKCYFASIWEQLQASETGSASESDVNSRLLLRPVYLPAISYLVETDDGWLSSIHARFQQARRHSQGVAELAYVFLQHCHLLMSERANRLSWSSHTRILGVAGKMASVHIIANMHSMALIMAVVMLVPGALAWLSSLSVSEILQSFAEHGLQGVLSPPSLSGISWALFAIFGPIPPMGMMMSAVTYLVVLDTIEGRLTTDAAGSKEKKADGTALKAGKIRALAAPDIQGSAVGQDGLSWWGRLQVFLMIQSDYFGGASVTMLFYGLLPASLAAWSLLRGQGFQYIVGAKPS